MTDSNEMLNAALPDNVMQMFNQMYDKQEERTAQISYSTEMRECYKHGLTKHNITHFGEDYEECFCLECEKEQRAKLEKEQEEKAQKEIEELRNEHIAHCKACNIEPEYYDFEFSSYHPQTPAQQKALDATKKMVAEKHGKVILLGPNGVGKEEWVEQIIPTPQGFRRFGDLKVGDFVFDETGKPTRVLGIFPQGFKDSYKLTFADGRSDECGLEHLWGVYIRNHGKWVYKVLSLKEMLAQGIYRKDGFAKFCIPSSPVIECEEKILPCDPYILGSFIGNGCCKESPLTISSADEWQVQKCANILGSTPKKCHSNNYSWIFKKGSSILKTRDILPKEICCFAHEKSIPQEYFFASVSQRQALLQGLFDTDGHAGAYGTRLDISYSTSSKKLAEDIQKLLLTFGISSHIGEDNRKGHKHCSYYLSINCSVEKAKLLFSLPRKLEIINAPNVKKGSHRDYSKVKIRRVEKLPEKKEMMCIWVENESHLYLTKDFLVTHNTALASIAAKSLNGKIYTMYEISCMIRQCYSSLAKRPELEIVEELASIPFLAIDELGRSKGSDAELNWLSYILDKRHTRRLPFMLLTNGHFKKNCPKGDCPNCFENFVDNDVLSRLLQDSTIISIKAPDNRRKNHQVEFFEDKEEK